MILLYLFGNSFGQDFEQHFMTEFWVSFLYRVLGDASGYDNWPTGRGIFFSNNKKFLVWVNEEDHLRIISMQQGGNLAEVWQRLVRVWVLNLFLKKSLE